jgi:hypothetical protein
LGTQDTGQRLEKTERAIKNLQFKETGNIGYTRHRTKIRENRRGNQEWTIQSNWQHWVHKTQYVDKIKQQHNTVADSRGEGLWGLQLPRPISQAYILTYIFQGS